MHAQIAALWRELERECGASADCSRCGKCCVFPEAGHVLYAERIEALFAVAAGAGADRSLLSRGLCPYFQGGACSNRAGRPLGCRAYFCAREGEERRREICESYLARLRAIALEGEVAIDYRPFLAHLRALL